MVDEKKTETENVSAADNKDKKIKNLISIVILLAGLFVGSLFVDVAQLLKGSGFSPKNLSQGDIFESGGKTWVAYNEPIVSVKVISDDTCDKCDPSEALVWLRRVLPTLSAQKVDFNSEEGKALVSQFSIRTLPAFIFADPVTQTSFYGQAQALFNKKDNFYSLDTQQLGLTPGKYLSLPAVQQGDALAGKQDASAKVFLFSDFQCPYCKLYWGTFREAIKQYGDRVVFDYKHFPLPFHAQANNAALASECALEQNKFWEYSDKLFAAQTEWSNAQGTQKFKDYAQQLGLNASQFNQCLDSQKYQSKIDADKTEGNNFGVSGTPATFAGSQFKNGVISLDELKTAIEAELK